MAQHFCPMCGIEHGHEEIEAEVVEATPIVEEVIDGPTDNEVTLAAIEALENVAEAAIMADAIADLAEEETEQVEAMTDADATIAEEESEVAIAEAIADGTQEPEAGETVSEDEGAPAADAEPVAPEESGEPTLVEPPPRDPEPEASTEHRRQSAFARRHRR